MQNLIIIYNYIIESIVYSNLCGMGNELLIWISIIYIGITLLLIYNVEIKLKISKRIKCFMGKHSFRTKRRKISSCEICGIIKDIPHLKVINGGKR
jgi:hypothetical protein